MRSPFPPRAAAERMARALPRLMPAICPLFIPARNDDAELIGSGVLLRVGPTEFLATAAHVMDVARGRLHVGAETKIIHVSGQFSETTAPNGDREQDRFDLAVIPLRESDVVQMRECRFLGLDELEPEERPDYRPIWGSKYFMVGFPATRQRSTRDDTVHVDPLLFSGRAMEPSHHQQLGWTVDKHLVIEYDKKRSWTIDGQTTAPDPYGVSGGGLFRLRGWFGEEPETETLVAIPIHYTGKAGKSVVATRVNILLDGIAKRYPHVSGHIHRFLASRPAS